MMCPGYDSPGAEVSASNWRGSIGTVMGNKVSVEDEVAAQRETSGTREKLP